MTARKPLVLVGGAPAQLPAGDTLENTVRTDLSQTFTAPQRAAYATLTDAATITVNLATALNFTVTLGGNRSVDAPSNPVAGQSGTIDIGISPGGVIVLFAAFIHRVEHRRDGFIRHQ